MDQAFFLRLKAHALMTPDKPAIVLRDRYITYRMLYAGIRSVQAALDVLNLSKSAPVGVLIDSPSRHLLVILALLKSGYCVSSLRPELISLAGDHKIATLIVDGTIPFQSRCTVINVHDRWFVTDPGENDTTAVAEPDRFVRIMFTSGTTGSPCPVAQTAPSLVNRLRSHYPARLASYERVLTTFGLSNAAWGISLAVLQNGNTLYFAPFDHVLETLFNYRIDALSGSSAQIEELVNRQSRSSCLIRLKLVQSGAGALPFNLQGRIREVFQAEPADTYFASEGGEMGAAYGAAFSRRVETQNCFFPTCKVEIVDEYGDVLPPHTTGRIRIKSSSMAWPFTGDLRLHHSQIGDGWFYPGDLGRFDAEGFLSVVGRSDEVINDGGTKFAPSILEERLKGLPGVADLAIFRTVAGDRQDIAGLAVVSEETISLAAINRWIQDNIPGELAGIRFYDLIRVSQIPRTDLGKIKRHDLARISEVQRGIAPRID